MGSVRIEGEQSGALSPRIVNNTMGRLSVDSFGDLHVAHNTLTGVALTGDSYTDSENATLVDNVVNASGWRGLYTAGVASISARDLRIRNAERQGISLSGSASLWNVSVTGSGGADFSAADAWATDLTLDNTTLDAVVKRSTLNGTTAPEPPTDRTVAGPAVEFAPDEDGRAVLELPVDGPGDASLWRYNGGWTPIQSSANASAGTVRGTVTESATVVPLRAEGTPDVRNISLDPADRALALTFDTNASLATLRATVARNGTPVITLDRDEFRETNGRYRATVPVTEPGTYTATLEAVDGAESGLSDTSTAVALSLAPANGTVPVDESFSYEVRVSPASGSVGGYEFDGRVADPSVAAVQNVTLRSRLRSAGIDDDGELRVLGAVANVSGPGPVTVATITLAGVEPGESAIALRDATVGATDGEPYLVVRTDAATLNVTAAPPVVVARANRSSDPDGDGAFEDVNGDGTADIVDVQALLAALERDDALDAAYFDFNGDGRVDVNDVQGLFAEVST